MMLTPKQQAKLRTVAFVAIAFWMFYGPIHAQILHGDARIFRGWTMYSGRAGYLFDVSFYINDNDVLSPINYQEMLKYNQPGKEWLTRMSSILQIGKKLCETTDGNADIRIIARQATTTGWLMRLNGSEKICENPENLTHESDY